MGRIEGAFMRGKTDGEKWEMETELNNTEEVPVLMIRLKITGE